MKHSPKDCEVCAAQYEADAVGAIPTAGHQPITLATEAASVARAIQAMSRASDNATEELTHRLFAFGEEIRRRAIEP